MAGRLGNQFRVEGQLSSRTITQLPVTDWLLARRPAHARAQAMHTGRAKNHMTAVQHLYGSEERKERQAGGIALQFADTRRS